MNNNEIFEESKEYMPGGVNSPVRCYKGMDMNPPIIKSGDGVIIKDEEDNEYIDFVLAWGPMLLGHCDPDVVKAVKETSEKALAFGAPTKLELDLAKFMCENLDNIDKIRMVNSGTEATMSAIKLARGYTKRDKIVKFAGCYHGHFDGFLVEAGSGLMTAGVPDSLGVPNESIANTLIGVYNDKAQITELFKKYGREIAGIIIEPVAGNMGVIKAEDDFMITLRNLCSEYGALLIFDEVMTGFRVAFKGAQSLFNIKPDLVTYAKIMGGGLPCGAYGGRKEIMENLSPLGGVYQAGTMSGNPIVMAAGLATLNKLKDNMKEYYEQIESIGKKLEEGIVSISSKYKLPLVINRVGGMFTIFFTELKEVKTYEDVKTCNIERFNRYFKHMIKSGFNFAPSQFEAVFLSVKHEESHVLDYLKAFEEFAINETK
ncbi:MULTISPECIES: glutamate-1-semialdehyde 2,1-aminomutase [Clostridium]|uniref:Glutamate-1-semialdehyde 2,1-aminomutase n=1 Tax=Clostridium carnis TaxID=1530 RepID=A0ABY6SUG5_9CLOT|nr:MULTISPECIES: glutamate-1-semialdehyde 2,1-aminomutase [Clostridium]CAI3556571.1 Glutamate-1-semialdehyde 2,1-aminotransferase (GSA) [Clostridium neonatale]CAI3560166.1 Glutamate-1-semialdehyde 2,1-aminotransferase (GSA) [Clostridium neonatale]CAI3612858.1 Glutamate-1-semialdehyde 2,1-aminotransferase (GSA) [Clostridium neonatale]CAI3621041.1 Glutamate-1-semialdehyde 2,1-aminotransferase (GSA) [Clostridium neonatale]CAI3680667.1 Glutamate-1-semialdehyde 2,1-aminotransferase (GSA) [Clostridi